MLKACVNALVLCSALAGISQADGPVFELRTYTCEPGKLEALHTRFRNHTMRIFEKHGIRNVGYWVPTEAPLSETTLVYLLEHKSQEAASASWDAFRNDPEWKQVAEESRQKDGKILAKAPEAVYLTLADFSPKVESISAETVFELRTYVTNEGKLTDLHNRFRDHTLKLFEKHGMTNLWYFTPQDEAASKNTLVYLLAHKNQEAAAESWKGFLGDPDWQAAYKASEANGPILSKRPDSMFLKLTEYSPTRQGK